MEVVSLATPSWSVVLAQLAVTRAARVTPARAARVNGVDVDFDIAQ
tara:strand:- start:226 stop:363 length:138 start_codon:yes stop_codon:yes gene_type:complete